MRAESILNLFKWLWPEHLAEELEGDLIQRFERDVTRLGTWRAKMRLAWQALLMCRAGIVLRWQLSTGFNQGIMIRNYLTVMKRVLMRNKLHSAINVFGLTTGITFALLIGTFVRSELHVNTGLADVDRLFLIESEFTDIIENNVWFAPAPLAGRVAEQYPQLVSSYYRFWDRQVTVSKGDKHFRVQTMIGDSTFLQMFGFPLLAGDAASALSKPNTIAITARTALQYFDRTEVVGETLTLTTEASGQKDYVITAVLKDLEAKNSVSDFMRMDAQIFLPIANCVDFSFSEQSPRSWTSDIITYVKLAPGANEDDARRAFNDVLKKELPNPGTGKRTVKLDALRDYYLLTDHGSVEKQLYALGAAVVFILMLAISNFINISIASSVSRLKEIGVRKVVGGVKRQVITQFLTESIMFAIISGVVSLILYEVLRVKFGSILESTLPSVIEFTPGFYGSVVVAIVIVGVLAGSYPAFYLSTVRPVESLKGKLASISTTLRLSRVLIGVQFLVAVFVFAAAVIMSGQVSYFLDRDMGYNKDFVLIVTSVPRQWSEEGMQKMDAAKKEFLRSSRVSEVSLSWGAPNANFSPTGVKIRNAEKPENTRFMATLAWADEDYDDVFGLKVLKGKFFFNEGEPFTQNSVVINETAQRTLQIEPGDKVKALFGSDVDFTVAGVVGDFNFESLHETVKPVIIAHTRDFRSYRYFSFRIQPGSLTDAVAEVEGTWKKVFPDDPFVYSFSDEKLRALYKTEFQLKKAGAVATGLMIMIVFTGVLGLVSLNVAKRYKEIGIRKVLGASSTHILSLVSREYAILMLLACIGGVPLSYTVLSRWLAGYAYHIELQWWMFALPVASLFVVTLLVVAGQSARAAWSNPVDSLRSE